MMSVIEYSKISKLPMFLVRMMSHFVYIHFDSAPSDYHESLDIFMKDGEYMLTSENAIQSWGENYYNFADVFNRIDLPENGSDVLVLGQGLASVVKLLENRHQKLYNYDIVEIDDTVARFCSTYILPDLESSINIIMADAKSYVEQSDKKYDMIIIDLFQDDQVPPKFYNSKFIQNVVDMLKPGGFFIQNLVELRDEQKQNNSIYISNLRQVGINTEDDKVYNSRMIIGPKNKKS